MGVFSCCLSSQNAAYFLNTSDYSILNCNLYLHIYIFVCFRFDGPFSKLKKSLLLLGSCESIDIQKIRKHFVFRYLFFSPFVLFKSFLICLLF